MVKKLPRTIGNQICSLECGFGIGYGISRKNWPIWVSVFTPATTLFISGLKSRVMKLPFFT